MIKNRPILFYLGFRRCYRCGKYFGWLIRKRLCNPCEKYLEGDENHD